jgi:hypothetical protein
MIPWHEGVSEDQRAEPGTDHREAGGKAPAAPRGGFKSDQCCTAKAPSSTQDDGAA